MKLKKNKSLKNEKSIKDIFWNFCPKNKTTIYFLETQKEGW